MHAHARTHAHMHARTHACTQSCTHTPRAHTQVAIKEARGDKVSAGTMKKAVVLETKYPTQRKNGSSFQVRARVGTSAPVCT